MTAFIAGEFNEKRRIASATIASAASLSGAIDLAGCVLVGIQMPSGWDAANLTFQGSADGVTYGDVYDGAGTEYFVTAVASYFIRIDPQDLVPIRYLKVRSGTTGTPVAQGAERVLTLIVRPV